MVRRLLILCSLAAFATGMSACSASGGQAGCVQPQLQTYPTPQMVYPKPGTTLSATGPQFVYFAYPTSPPLLKVGGLFTMTPADGHSVGIPLKSTDALPPGSATPQSGFTQFYYGSVGKLTPKTTYAVSYAVTYTLGCLAGDTTKTYSVGSFNSP